MTVRGRRLIVTFGLLVPCLVNQMPWMLGIFVLLHGSHEATVTGRHDRVVVVFSHQPTESNSEDDHDDHALSFSVEENYVRRVTSNGPLLVRAAAIFTLHVLLAPAIGQDAAMQPSLYADHAPPLLALRTVVLMV